MMFIRDLAPYRSQVEEDGNNLVAIGWLSEEHEFEKGDVPQKFPQKLSYLCAHPIRKSRGFHVCPFCKQDNPETGSGEIRIAGMECVYVAPELVGHYVIKHGYKPPEAFIEAVSSMSQSQSIDMHSDLAELVIRLADSPTEENKLAFYRSLLNGRVGIRVPQELGAVPSGEYVTTVGSNLRIPTAMSPTGEDMLLVLVNVNWLHECEPGSVFVEMDGCDVLQMAQDSGAGVIVQVLGPDRQAWSGVPPTDIDNVLALGRKKGT